MARMIPLKKDGQVRSWLNTDQIVSVRDNGERRRIHTVNGGQFFTEESLETVVGRINEPNAVR